jgi:hypothetical protein
MRGSAFFEHLMKPKASARPGPATPRPMGHAGGSLGPTLLLVVLMALSQMRHAAAKSSAASLPHGPGTTKLEVAHAGEPSPGTRVRAKAETTIYWKAAAVRPRRAIVETGGVVALDGTQVEKGAGCRAGWAKVVGGGFLCVDHTEPTRDPVRPMPLVDGLLPFVFVHRLESKAFSYAFLPGEGEARTQLFRRGKPLDKSRYALHTPSHFHGRNLERDPLPSDDLIPGWTVAAEASVYEAPAPAARVVAQLDLHTPVLVGRRPAAKGWREVRDAKGKRKLGFMREDGSLRYWVGAAPVHGLQEGETWLDIDVGQQMIALRSFGTGPIYVTLISSGLPERPSPLGVFHLQYKLAYHSMGNLPNSADQYFVENVPWTMYFLPNYAIHGAYWHNEFGNRRSHGCVNLAPRDARYIYERVPPHQQASFFRTFTSDQAPGAVVRVRDSAKVSDGNRDTTRADSRS